MSNNKRKSGGHNAGRRPLSGRCPSTVRHPSTRRLPSSPTWCASGRLPQLVRHLSEVHRLPTVCPPSMRRPPSVRPPSTHRPSTIRQPSVVSPACIRRLSAVRCPPSVRPLHAVRPPPFRCTQSARRPSAIRPTVPPPKCLTINEHYSNAKCSAISSHAFFRHVIMTVYPWLPVLLGASPASTSSCLLVPSLALCIPMYP